ncbi:trypsin-like peptidase domain-containing protein [Streptomyces flavofungini]|uniref:VMAP-C domain-containing protein n=1 Tax=Streptomyces flavofungini TaxID=68200 RepID=UPI0025B0BA8D|nr:trypsin-like peptidase domain-containing protein [Streptomyces flavofungini]WJV45312.1 trypsin-like peptidase domain-containing protein [Streptomyces flavofungini]
MTGWPGVAAGAPPVVAVLARADESAVGAAALLSAHRVLTCAHVVNEALGLAPLSEQRPVADVLQVGFERRTVRIKAQIEVWLPPRRGGGAAWQGDLCVLALSEPAPAGTAPVAWTEMAQGQRLRAWHGCGDPITFADARLKLLDDRLGYLDGELSGAPIGPGFSGGPLWTEGGTVAAGLVVGRLAHGGDAGHGLHAGQTVRRTWALPWQAIREQLYAAGADDVVDACRGTRAPVPDDPVAAELVAVLRSLLGDPAVRADHVRRLDSELGRATAHGAPAPAVEALAADLLATPRALPTLSESLVAAGPYGTRPEQLTPLLALGRAVSAAGLLSTSEFAFLERVLGQVVAADATLPARAAREALRFTPLPQPLCAARLRGPDVAAVIEELEGYHDPVPVSGSPPVPPLVHFVEFVAAAADRTPGDALRLWSERVCARLGVHAAARDQRRADAARWGAVASRSEPVVRLLAELAQDGSREPERYRCRLWQRLADGGMRRVETGTSEATLTPQQVGELIREAAELSAPAGTPLAVDVAVDRAGLHLPVDEWDAGSPNEFVPSLPLGVCYPVTLRCPEMSRRVPRREAEHRRRWADGHGRALVVDGAHADARQVAALLTAGHHDANQVVLHAPPALRGRLLEVCLALGVPVVLWDRDARGDGDADRLDPLTPTGLLHRLPDRVREFRVQVLAATTTAAGPSGRPSLVWEEPAAWQDPTAGEPGPWEGPRARLTDPDILVREGPGSRLADPGLPPRRGEHGPLPRTTPTTDPGRGAGTA